jgi:hypothetical protein
VTSLILFGFLFETPLAALAVAAGAASLPILIHLLNRRRFRVVDWAAMRFLLAAQRKNTRRMRLEQLLLLAVRTLLVLLLVAAMASIMPWAESLWARVLPDRAGGVGLGGRTHKILVLDGSLSMGLRTGELTCFERARALALEVLRDASGGDGFSVVLMAAPPRRIVPEPSDDAGRVRDEVKALRLPHGNADLAATLTGVEDMLRHSPTKFDQREVYFFTDLQRATWTARQSGDPGGILQRLGALARVVLVDVGQEAVVNTAVTHLALGVPVPTTGSATPITATVQHYNPEPRKQVRAELLVGKARSGAGEPAFALHVVNVLHVDLAPGQNLLTFSHRFTTSGEYALQVRLEGDALDLDDTRTLIVTVKDTVPVLLVNGKPAAEVYDRATEWLHDALNPFQHGASPRNAAARPKVVTESQFADAALGDLTPYDCVFLCDVARLDAAEVHRLEMHLRQGGGVVFCLGPNVDLEAYNRLVFRGGEGILPAQLVGRRRAPERQFFNLAAEERAYHEPPLEAFAAERDRAGLLATRFREYVKVELPPGRARTVLSFLPEIISGRTARDLRRPAERETDGAIPVGGEPALVEATRFRGRSVLFTSTVNMDWTTWPISPSYLAFWQEVLHFAAAGRLRGQEATVGEVLEEYLPAGGAGLEATLRLPDGRTEGVHTEAQDEVGVLRWADTDQSGLYRATIGQDPREHLFAVNVPAAADAQEASESDPARTNLAALQSAYPGWDFQLVTDLGQVNHSVDHGTGSEERPGGVLGRAVAHFLLLAVLGLLVTEVVLAWRFGHYRAAAPGASVSQPSGILGTLASSILAGTATLLFLCLAAVWLHAVWTGDFLGFLPDALRRGIEARLGVPAPAPGEGTRWRLEFMPYFRDAASDPWLAGGLALLLLVLVPAIYTREGRTASRGYKLFLAGLRLFLFLLTLAVLLPQVRLSFEREGWPDIALVLDDSRSMSANDRYQDPAVREAAANLAREAALTEPERLQLAQALLAHPQRPWLEALLTRRRLKLHVYHCSSRAARIADVLESSQLDAATRAVRDLRAVGESSQLGTAVRQVLNDFRGSSLTAVVLLTDGVTTEGEDLVKVGHYAAGQGVPLYFVGLGDVHEVRDLQLHDLSVEDTVYVHDRLMFEARLTAQGYTDGRTVPVILSEKGADGRPRELARERVTTDPEGKPVKFRIAHRPTEPGEKVYVLEVPEQEDEVRPATNNRLERTIFVREAKRIRVLYVEGYARYEYRFLKNLLERESDREKGNKSIELNVLLLDADSEYASEDRSAIADFPTREELNAYDVILWGDVDPRDKKIGERVLEQVADFVRERGGGLLMIAGPRYSPQAYADTPLRDVLPVRVVGRANDPAQVTMPFHPELTPAGRFHPIFRFSPDEAENTAIWNHLAEIYWWSEGYRTQPAAEVLLIHPQRPAAGLKAGSVRGAGEGGHPLLVQQFVGAGRSMFLGFEETWRWRLREDEPRYNQFWIQAVRYLARSRLGRVELHLDRETPYRRGEPIRVRVRFPDDAPPPAPDSRVEVLVARTTSRPEPGGAAVESEKETLRLTKVEGSRATYEGLLTRTPEGAYRFWLSQPEVAGAAPRAEARVLPPPGEMEQLRMNRADLERAAEETHGHFYTLADADHLLDDLPSGSRVALSTPQPPQTLWNHAAVFGLALGLLGAEWVLRKRKHLL